MLHVQDEHVRDNIIMEICFTGLKYDDNLINLHNHPAIALTVSDRPCSTITVKETAKTLVHYSDIFTTQEENLTREATQNIVEQALLGQSNWRIIRIVFDSDKITIFFYNQATAVTVHLSINPHYLTPNSLQFSVGDEHLTIDPTSPSLEISYQNSNRIEKYAFQLEHVMERCKNLYVMVQHTSRF